MVFESITEESLEVVMDIVNSNQVYNVLENGNPLRSLEEIRSEFFNSETGSFLIKMESKYIGILDFLKHNPKDDTPWIGLLMIHRAYHSLGYGKIAYIVFEETLKQRNFNKVRIGVLQQNRSALKFWKSLGFSRYGSSDWNGHLVDCFEKSF